MKFSIHISFELFQTDLNFMKDPFMNFKMDEFENG